MLINDILHISAKYTKYDYFNLRLSLNSSPEEWSKAVDILKDRIIGRYFTPIKELIKGNRAEKNGFAAMSLMCLLIDTFMQFENGYPQSSDDNRAKYVWFLRNSLKFGNIESNLFYFNIRCGLLHSAETKNGSYLIPDYFDSYTGSDLAVKMDEVNNRNILVVSVRRMFDILEIYFNDYCSKLLKPGNDNDIELRNNFIVKMDFLTLKNDRNNGDLNLWSAICRNAGKMLKLPQGPMFTYEKSYKQFSLVIKRFGMENIIIPFSDIKDYASCNNIDSLYRRRESLKQIKRSEYIKIILSECRDEVKEYTNELAI